jgi:anhydro-N-acetylmuramic acid kinase
MAAGGQGAPLVPAFHQSVFHNSSETNVVLNIGGIANITVLPPNPADTSGFDTGPGNVLLDSWAQLYLGTNMDENGDWGANGQVDDELLNLMLTDKYFSLAAPKSTGREDFNLDWLKSILNDCSKTPNTPEQAQNIQASLCALTAHSISSAIKSHAALTKKVLVCGGGIHNKALMKLLTSLLDGCELISTEQYGIHPDWVEAAAFAWLAKQRIENQAGNIPNVTGAKHPVILGAIYPAAVNPQSS